MPTFHPLPKISSYMASIARQSHLSWSQRTLSIISYMLRVHFIWKTMEIKVYCTGLECTQIQKSIPRGWHHDSRGVWGDWRRLWWWRVFMQDTCASPKILSSLVQYHPVVKGIAFCRQSHVACTRHVISYFVNTMRCSTTLLSLISSIFNSNLAIA